MTCFRTSHEILISAPATTVGDVTADISVWPGWSPAIASVANWAAVR